MVATSSDVKPIAIIMRENSRGPIKRVLAAAARSDSIWKNLYIVNPNVIRDVAVRIHDINVRS